MNNGHKRVLSPSKLKPVMIFLMHQLISTYGIAMLTPFLAMEGSSYCQLYAMAPRSGASSMVDGISPVFSVPNSLWFVLWLGTPSQAGSPFYDVGLGYSAFASLLFGDSCADPNARYRTCRSARRSDSESVFSLFWLGLPTKKRML